MKPYIAPQLTDYGDVAEITAILGEPFVGDQAFDVDGNVIESGNGSINVCPTIDNEECFYGEDRP